MNTLQSFPQLKPWLRSLSNVLLGTLATEYLLIKGSRALTSKILAALCAHERQKHHDEEAEGKQNGKHDSGYYCSTIPFAKRLTSLITRAFCYAVLFGTQLGYVISSLSFSLLFFIHVLS